MPLLDWYVLVEEPELPEVEEVDRVVEGELLIELPDELECVLELLPLEKLDRLPLLELELRLPLELELCDDDDE